MLGCAGELVRDAAAATQSLSCGTSDKDCNEVKYLQEALDLLESFTTETPIAKPLNLFLVERSSSS